MKNPELAVYKIQNAAYKYAFLLVPISLPFVWLLFIWRRGTTLFDHAVYILYSLSFVSLLFIDVRLVWRMIPGAPGVLARRCCLAGSCTPSSTSRADTGSAGSRRSGVSPFQLLFALMRAGDLPAGDPRPRFRRRRRLWGAARRL